MKDCSVLVGHLGPLSLGPLAGGQCHGQRLAANPACVVRYALCLKSHAICAGDKKLGSILCKAQATFYSSPALMTTEDTTSSILSKRATSALQMGPRKKA